MSLSTENIVTTWENNMNVYRGKTTNYIIRITADELGMHREDLIQALNEYYDQQD